MGRVRDCRGVLSWEMDVRDKWGGVDREWKGGV